MKHVYILVLVLFYSLGFTTESVGQEEIIIVLSCQGKAQFNSEGGSAALQLIPGLELEKTGTVFVENGGRLRLIINQKSVLLTGPGRYDLNELYVANTKKSMSFSSRFWKFVVSGMGSTKDKKDLVKYHREFMQSHGDIKGFADINADIILSPVIRDNIAIDVVRFEWKLKDSTLKSHFRIVNDKRTEVFSQMAENNFLSLNLNEIGLSFGASYTWSVSINKMDQEHSAELRFEYIPHKQSVILEKLLYLEEYLDAEPQEKLWLKAVMLEMENYFYEADLLYRELISNDQENLFLKKSYALFLCRQNKLEQASKTL